MKTNKVSFFFQITFTKAFSLLVLLVGSIFSFINKDANVMIYTLSLSAGLAGLKAFSDGLTERSHTKYKNNPTPYEANEAENNI